MSLAGMKRRYELLKIQLVGPQGMPLAPDIIKMREKMAEKLLVRIKLKEGKTAEASIASPQKISEKKKSK